MNWVLKLKKFLGDILCQKFPPQRNVHFVTVVASEIIRLAGTAVVQVKSQ